MTTPTLRIAINGSMLDEKPTGVGVYTYNVINTLNRICHNAINCNTEITVYSPTRKNLESGVRIVDIPGIMQSSKYGKFAALTRFIWNSTSYSAMGRSYDLMVNPTTHGSFLRKNQIITIHDLLSLRFRNISSHQRFYFSYVLPFMVSRCRTVVAVSQATKNDIVKFLRCTPDKVEVIYNGYDNLRFNLINASGSRIADRYGVASYILAVGPTYPHKNFEILFQAYAKLDLNYRKMHPLVIAGGMPRYVEQLQKLATTLEISKNVFFLGYVPAELMASLYGEASVLVFPSLYEGFGFPLLEAMACGCPVIASDTSSIPEVCGNAALMFDPQSESELVSHILSVSGNDDLRTSLIQKGLERVKMFLWEKTGQKWMELLNKAK